MESTFLVFAPEAEPLVKPFRTRYDPAASVGIPAHITILYPFKPPHEVTPPMIDCLETLFGQFPSFTLSLVETRRFPGVLYLAPAPDKPLIALTEAVVSQFPENPPYGGAYSTIIPHLTVAETADKVKLEEISAEFMRAAQGHLPLPVKVSEVAWMDNSQGSWKLRRKFNLAEQR